MPTDEQIAAAVNGYCKALRLLKREKTSVGSIAEALGLSTEQVEASFGKFKISRAKVSDNLKTYQATSGVILTHVVHLAK